MNVIFGIDREVTKAIQEAAFDVFTGVDPVTLTALASASSGLLQKIGGSITGSSQARKYNAAIAEREALKAGQPNYTMIAAVSIPAVILGGFILKRLLK